MKPADPSSYDAAFRALARLIDIGVLILDPDRGLDFISDRARQLLQCHADDDWDACWDRARPTIEPILDRVEPPSDAMREGNPVRATVTLEQTVPAQQLELELHRLRDADEQLAGHLLLIKDKDTFQRVEQSLRLAMQMHHTGRLYEALAHDLRQPIGAVLIHLRILDELRPEMDTSDAHRAQYRESVATIRNEVKELDDSLRLLLRELSPTDTRERVPLHEVMHSVVRLIEPQVEKAGLALDTHFTDEDVVVQGRRFRIRQAILNLATNALEAMTAGTLTLRLRADGQHACIDVIDEGPGIPAWIQARMYERHFTTKESGTGLGLHIVKQTADAHGGTVTVETDPEAGTTFSLCLPRATEEDRAEAAGSSAEAAA